MDSLILFFTIFLVILFLFVIVNITIFKNVEKYGIYCGRYNMNKKTAKEYCKADYNCQWNSYKDPATNIRNSWCSDSTSPTLKLEGKKNNFKINMNSYNLNIPEQPCWIYTPTVNKWYKPSVNNLIGNWNITKVKSSNNMTILFWINITSLNPDWINIFHVTNDNNNINTSGSRVPGIWIYPNSTTLQICNDTKERFNSYFSSTGIQLNTPALITITWNNQTITSYVNGIAQATVSYPSPLILAQPSAKFYMKDKWYNNSIIKNFEIKNFSLFNHPLSQPDISTIYVDQNLNNVM